MPAIATTIVLSLTTFSAADARCGRERWSVKTGTDPDAKLVNLNVVQPSTIAELTSMTEPDERPDDARLQPAEVTVYQVTATLTDYKWENSQKTGDDDYHLVLKDDASRAMIVEIPSPKCVDNASPFHDAVHAARAAFDAQLKATGKFKIANQRVRVTGVGFFDFTHGQRGLAPNGLELHPVLAIEFEAVPGAFTTTTAAANRAPAIRNGGFEAATRSGLSSNGWDRQTFGTRHNLIVVGGTAPHTGSNYAALGGYINTNDWLSQTVHVPADLSNPSLTFWLHITGQTSGNDMHNLLFLHIFDDQDRHIATPLVLDGSDTRPDYFQPPAVDLNAYRGKTITVVFQVVNGAASPTIFRIDDVAIRFRQ